MQKRFCLHDSQGRTYLALTDVVRLEADGCYTIVYATDGKKYVQSGSICKYYDRLQRVEDFFRIHKSHIVNLQYVVRINNCGSVIMRDGTHLPISEEARRMIEERMTSY